MITALIASALAGEVLAERTSRYGLVQVVERDGVRELLLDGAPQTAYDPRYPQQLTYDYNVLLAAGLCAWPGYGDRAGEVRQVSNIRRVSF